MMVKTSGAKAAMWDVVPGVVKKQKPLEVIVPQADVLFLCVNSWHIRSAAAMLAPYLHQKTIIVSPSKGIEANTCMTVDALLADAFPKGQPIALLSGPMLAHELAEGGFGAAVVATKKSKDFTTIAALFKKSRLRLEYAQDLRAVALAGVLKNTYALMLGIADALDVGQNAKGYLASAAAEELARVIRTLHITGDAFHALFGPAGLGDLIATGFSAQSTNVSLGRDLVAGNAITRMSEGFASLPPLMELLGKHTAHFPILSAVANVALKKKDAKKVFGALLQ
ncbi:MAG: hypothetical protein RL141_556 [Candidatus Parcubacteria bacterium]|jgi:glycerol-3-phosphate dehydrogenase (NAD(P)+)